MLSTRLKLATYYFIAIYMRQLTQLLRSRGTIVQHDALNRWYALSDNIFYLNTPTLWSWSHNNTLPQLKATPFVASAIVVLKPYKFVWNTC